LHAGPVWDFNIAFGNVNYCEGNNPEGWIYDVHCDGGNPFWWGRMLEDPVFLQVLQCRWQELSTGPLQLSAIDAFVQEQVALLQPALARNFERWPVQGEYVWPNAEVLDTHEEEIDYLMDFIEDRLLWMDLNMPGLCDPSDANQVVEQEFDFKVFPIPFADKVTLEIDLPRDASVSIKLWDTLGRLLLDDDQGILPAGKQQQQLPLHHVPNGMYWLEVTAGSIQSFRRIVRTN
jgi:hypothetical protein